VFEGAEEDLAARVYEKRGAQSAWIPESPEICFEFEVRQRVKQIGRLFQIRSGIF
jgi:hypothetical protein